MKIALVIFCYNRLDKFENLLSSLDCNDLSLVDKCFVFQDGLKNDAANHVVHEHAKLKNTWLNFAEKNEIKSHDFTLRARNVGLRDSIINGLDFVFLNFDAAIVLEDDLQLDSSFVMRMRELLINYRHDSIVGHINGWSNFQTIQFRKNHLIKTSMMYCWGWATWKTRWQDFRDNFDWSQREFSMHERLRYDYIGLGRLIHQLKLNWSGRIKTWAVFWYLYIRVNNLKCIGYANSLTKNVGNDGSGDNCKKIDSLYFSRILNGEISNSKSIVNKISATFNMVYFINLIANLFYRDFYLLLRKFVK